MVDAIVERVAQTLDPWSRECDVVPVSLVSSVVGPEGRSPSSVIRPECEMAPELLRTGVYRSAMVSALAPVNTASDA